MPVGTRDNLNASPVQKESNVIDRENGGGGKTFIFPSATPFNAELIKSLMFIEFSGRTIESIGSFVRLENVIQVGQEIGK
jgi:Mor family transcriptional regulator